MPDGTIRPMFRALGISASGLSAQRQRMDTIAQNIANADVTRGPDGGPYKRREVILESATRATALYPGPSASDIAAAGGGARVNVSGINGTESTGDTRRTIEVPVLSQQEIAAGDNGMYGVRVAGFAEDQGEGRLVYEPGHPDANASGYVRYPDINTVQETARMLEAKRLYEANAAVFQVTKSMLRASIDI